jgi:hypothetical protein
MKHAVLCQINSIAEYIVTHGRQGDIPPEDLQVLEDLLHLAGSAVGWERRKLIEPNFWEEYRDGDAA